MPYCSSWILYFISNVRLSVPLSGFKVGVQYALYLLPFQRFEPFQEGQHCLESLVQVSDSVLISIKECKWILKSFLTLPYWHGIKSLDHYSDSSPCQPLHSQKLSLWWYVEKPQCELFPHSLKDVTHMVQKLHWNNFHTRYAMAVAQYFVSASGQVNSNVLQQRNRVQQLYWWSI